MIPEAFEAALKAPLLKTLFAVLGLEGDHPSQFAATGRETFADTNCIGVVTGWDALTFRSC